MSATYSPRPRIRRSSSLRGNRAPTPCPASGPPAEEKSPSLRTMAAPRSNCGVTSLGRNGLWQDRRDRVVSRTGAETERGLQQAFGDDLVLLVVAKHKSPGLLRDDGDVSLPADLERSDFVGAAKHF